MAAAEIAATAEIPHSSPANNAAEKVASDRLDGAECSGMSASNRLLQLALRPIEESKWRRMASVSWTSTGGMRDANWSSLTNKLTNLVNLSNLPA